MQRLFGSALSRARATNSTSSSRGLDSERERLRGGGWAPSPDNTSAGTTSMRSSTMDAGGHQNTMLDDLSCLCVFSAICVFFDFDWASSICFDASLISRKKKIQESMCTKGARTTLDGIRCYSASSQYLNTDTNRCALSDIKGGKPTLWRLWCVRNHIKLCICKLACQTMPNIRILIERSCASHPPVRTVVAFVLWMG